MHAYAVAGRQAGIAVEPPATPGTPSVPTVICLHSSGSSSRQWAALAARLAGRAKVLTPDLQGHGAVPNPSVAGVDDERRLEGLLLEAPGAVHLVGHSYGATLALYAALRQPRKVRTLALYEPLPFALVDRYHHPRVPAVDPRAFIDRLRRMLACGDLAGGARAFYDFWSGEGAWARLAAPARAALIRRISWIIGHFRTLVNSPFTLADYVGLRLPVLILIGTHTRAPARRLAELLEYVMRGATFRRLPGLGHLGPITDPDVVNDEIEAFFAAHATEMPAGSMALA